MGNKEYAILLSNFDSQFFLFDLEFLTCKKCASIVLKSEIRAQKHVDWHRNLKQELDLGVIN